MTALALLAAAVVAANPGSGVHLAALGLVVVVALTVYGVVRWRRRRDNPEAESPPQAHDQSSADPWSKTPRP